MRLLITRLERLPVDSGMARRASGVRGNIIKVLEESTDGEIDALRLDRLIEHAFTILKVAAQAIPDQDYHR